MHKLLAALTFALLALPLRAAAEEVPPPPLGEEAADHPAAVAEAVRDAGKIGDEELWERAEKLRRMGPEAAEAMLAAIEEAHPRARLLLAKHLLDVRGYRGRAAAVLVELCSGAEEVKLRLWAANSLGQATMLTGSRTVLDSLEKAAAAEKDKLVMVAVHRARGRLGADAAAADALLILMRNNRGAVRKEAALALGDLGRAMVPEVKREILLIFKNDPTARADRALSIYRRALARYPLLDEVLQRIAEYYDDETERKELVRSAVRGMVGSLDPFSGYMDPAESKQLAETLTGEYGGIGAYVNLVDGVFTIVSPIYGGPAHRAGLRSMDRVLEVDGVKTAREALNKTIRRLKGKPGTDVKVKIFRRGWREGQEFTITRAKISVHSIFSELLPGGIGYVRVVRFAPKTAGELKKTLTEMAAGGMKGLVIDVRDNPGGYLLSAVNLADQFLPAGKVIVSSKGRRARTYVHRSTGRGEHAELPLVVLINSGSASASEILAGALRDNDRAALVGQKTFGKGSVQEPIRLRSEPGSLIKLTVAKYYLPKGESIHEKGLKPDAEVKSEDEITPGWKYEELRKAVDGLESYALEAYKKDPEFFRKLAGDDGGDPARYPGLAQQLKKLGVHLAPGDVRPFVRRVVRQQVADDRNRRFVANLEDDRQLKRAALVLLRRMGLAGALPAPYDRYHEAFEKEKRSREAQATGRMGPVQESGE